MKAFLVISILILSLCSEEEEPLEGGWEKIPLNNKNYADLDEDVVNAYIEALKLLSNQVGRTLDDIIPLACYVQIVSGKNYKISFIDRRADYPSIHQYVFYKPLAVNNDGKEEYQLFYHEELEVKYGLIEPNDKDFTLLENELYKLLKKKDKKLNYISYAFPLEGEDNLFFIISAEIDNGHYQCVMGQDKRSNKFDLVKIIK